RMIVFSIRQSERQYTEIRQLDSVSRQINKLAEQASLGERREESMTSSPGSGIVNISRHRSVEQTVEKLEDILRAKGVKLFALVDHSGEAEKAGMHMRPTKLMIFGNPKAGTPLM